MDASLFISDTIHERKIKTDKGEITLWFKELPNTTHLRFVSAIRSDDHDARSGAMAKYVSQSLCDVNGELALTFEEACRLKVSILDQMLVHVRSLGKDEKAGKESPSEEKSGSGTHLPSLSAADQ